MTFDEKTEKSFGEIFKNNNPSDRFCNRCSRPGASHSDGNEYYCNEKCSFLKNHKPQHNGE